MSEEQVNIKKMSKTEFILWCVAESIGTGSVLLTQLAAIEGLKIPAVAVAVAVVIANTARILWKKYKSVSQ